MGLEKTAQIEASGFLSALQRKLLGRLNRGWWCVWDMYSTHER